jgi:hypothetical protein
MSKKKLLEESTIRSFMKLANLQPLTDKFIKESWKQQEEGKVEEELQEESELEEEGKVEEAKKDEGKMKESARTAPPADTERDPETVKQEEQLEEEVVEEEGDKVEEGKESEGRPASPKQAPKGTSLAGKSPGKMDAAKNAPKDAKLTPMKQTHVHSDKPDSIEHNKKSNAPKKNNAQFDVVSESLQEMDKMEDEAAESPDMGGEAEMGSAGETGEHKEKMKGLIRDMLGKLSEMGAEYGLQMEVNDEGAAGAEEAAPESPEPEAPPAGEEDEAKMMEQKLDEMVEKLTQRVAARLVKETKKKR